MDVFIDELKKLEQKMIINVMAFMSLWSKTIKISQVYIREIPLCKDFRGCVQPAAGEYFRTRLEKISCL